MDSQSYPRQSGMGQTLPPLTTTMLPATTVIPVSSSSHSIVTGQQVQISVGNWQSYNANGELLGFELLRYDNVTIRRRKWR